MCNQLLDIDKCGLGFFDIDVNTNKEISVPKNLEEGEIAILNKSRLLEENRTNLPIRFNLESRKCLSEYSTAAIDYDGTNYPFLHESSNYYGLDLNIERNEKLVQQIIGKFIKL